MKKCVKCKCQNIKKTEIEGLTKKDILIKYLCENCGWFGFTQKKEVK